MANAIPTDLKDRNRVAIVTGQKVKMCYNGEEIEGIVRVRGYRYRKRLFCVETKEGIRYPFGLMTNPRKQIEVIENYKYKQDERTKI